ncbi:MAG TPA: hypothetical protein PLV12_06205 [Saprospiraceae bacterium]|nr:hypothetical protein [Saprospiraceae bacterium]
MKKTDNNPVKKDPFTSDKNIPDRSFLNKQPSENSQPVIKTPKESRPNVADPKNLKYGPDAPLKEPDQNNPNERQGYKNREEMNAVEHRLMRTKSANPDKTYRTHIERNNNQTGIPKKDNTNL